MYAEIEKWETGKPSGYEMGGDGDNVTSGPNPDKVPCHKCQKAASTSWKHRANGN